MSKSVWEINEERKKAFHTKDNTFDMFPVGSKVKIICICQDFNFFDGNETGEVIKNDKEYLSIIVKFDEPRHFKDGSVQKDFGFNPEDLSNKLNELYEI